MPSVKRKNVTIIGMSLSGAAAALLARHQGAVVRVSEHADTPYLRRTGRELKRQGIAVEWGGHTRGFFDKSELVITSPGVTPRAKPLLWARQRRVPVISEMAFAAWHCHRPIIAVTGSNGKTTVTTLIGRLLRGAGYRAVVCGNIGIPLSSVVMRRTPADMIVLEVSSFQLEYASFFRPRMSVVLNLTQNHLDHHPTLAAYRAAKARLVVPQGRRQYAVLNFDDQWVRGLRRRTRASVYYFTSRENMLTAAARSGCGACGIQGGWIVYRDASGTRPLVPLAVLRVAGVHNQENVMASLLAVRPWRVARASAQRTVERFAGLEHRCETVVRHEGITYVNDAKSTTADATAKALQLYADRSVVLICGGRDKGSDFSSLRTLIQRKVHTLYAIGEAGPALCAVFEPCTRTYRAASMQEAVRRAVCLAQPGMTVLLSPMCASFDMFRNYEHRGRTFKTLVARELRRP